MVITTETQVRDIVLEVPNAIPVLEHFGIELSSARWSMGTGDGAEIGIPQLELEGARFQIVLAEAPRHHFTKAGQRGFDVIDINRVLIEGVLVADGFRSAALAKFGIVPAARILAARLAGQSHAPFAKAFFEEIVV